MTRLALASALAGALLAACGDDLTDPFEGLALVSGPSPFAASCTARQAGVNFRGAEVEPSVAVNPTDPRNLVGVWQQDRWSSGAASGTVTGFSFDGGHTWSRVAVPFSRCAGAAAGEPGDYQRATDPWVTFTPDGVAYQVALALDNTTARNAILASRSDDGGRTWARPSVLIADDDPDVFNDKETVTADPVDPTRVYVVWDRLTGLSHPRDPGTGPTWFARSDATGWEPAKILYDPGLDAQTIGNQIVVLPDGTLVNAFTELAAVSTMAPVVEIKVVRSADQGDTWSAPITVAAPRAVQITDRLGTIALRTGAIIADVEVDPRSGALYLAWEDARFTPGGRNGIVLARSTDGGLTWSPPQLVSRDGGAGSDAFTPSLAVNADGVLGLSYYETSLADFFTTAWLATSSDGGERFREEPLTGAFDVRRAQLGAVYFLGDYQGLAAAGSSFLPFFAGALDHGSLTGIYARPLPQATTL